MHPGRNCVVLPLRPVVAYEYRCPVCGDTWLCPDMSPVVASGGFAEAARSPWIRDTSDWGGRHARTCGAPITTLLERLRPVDDVAVARHIHVIPVDASLSVEEAWKELCIFGHRLTDTGDEGWASVVCGGEECRLIEKSDLRFP